MRQVAGAVLGVLLLAGPALADPTPTPTVQEPEAPLAVSVTELLPRAPQAGQAFEVAGAVRNTSRTLTVTRPRVRLALGNVIQSRGELHEAQRDGADFTSRSAVRPVYADPRHTRALDVLRPGQVGYFDIQTDVDSLGLRRTGVYPLDVEARGAVDDTGNQDLGAVPTWIPFFAADAHPRRNKVAVVLPLTDRPHQAPDGSFVDDDLATSFSSGSLAHLLVAAGYSPAPGCDKAATRNDGVRDPRPTRCEPVPISYAVDPDLVSAAYAMATAQKYRVGTGKSAKDGTGKKAAQLWLDRLKTQAGSSRGSVLVLPYGDPDVDALAQTAAGQLDLAEALRLGNEVLSDQVPGTRVDAVLPPSQGSGILTPQAADALRPQSAQPFGYVLDESAFPDLEDAGRTRSPSAHVTLGPSTDPLHALVVEDTLSTLVLGQTGPQEGDRLAEQRFIAETAIIAAEAPGTSRTFVIAPDRYADGRVQAMAHALLDLGQLPWLCPVALEPLTQPADSGGGESCPNPTSPTEARRNVDRDDPRTGLRQGTDAQLPTSYLDKVTFQGRRAAQLTQQVLGGPDPLSAADSRTIDQLQRRLHQAVARAESSAWRQDPSAQQSQADQLSGALTALVSQVNVRTGRVLLTSDKGSIQVAVENASDLPLQVRLRFTIPGRRDLLETGLVVVPPRQSVPASVKVAGLRSGTFPIQVQMVDRAGKDFRGYVNVQVQSTRYGRLALGLTFAAAAVLFIAAGTRIVRRAIRKAPAA